MPVSMVNDSSMTLTAYKFAVNVGKHLQSVYDVF